MAVPESQRYASAFYTLWQGHALWIPEPNSNLGPEYGQIGVRIGDVGILNANGSFDYLFNVCHSPNDPINRLSRTAPTHFEQLIWNEFVTEVDNVFRSGFPIMSHVAREQAFGAGATATLPGIPVGGGAGFSTGSSMGQSAVILPFNGAHSTDCKGLALFCNYAKKHGVSWYAHVREVLGMQVANGDIFFVTGFNKTKCWENALFSHSMRDRVFDVAVNGGNLAGAFGHFSHSSSQDIFISRCSPLDNENYNQALFIRGFRVSLRSEWKTFFRGPSVKVTSTDPSWKDTSGKRSGGTRPEIPRGQESSSESKPSSGSRSHQGTSPSAPSSLSSDIADISQVADARYIVDTYKEDLLSQVYDPSRAINDFIAQSAWCMSDKDDFDVIITHDKYWVALLTDQDIEMPNKQELLRRLKVLLLDHRHSESMSISADDILAFLLLETAEAFGILSNLEPARIPPVMDYLQAEAKGTDLNNEYGQKCAEILYNLVNKHHMLPPSLFVNEITLESHNSIQIQSLWSDTYKGTYQKSPVCLKVLWTPLAGKEGANDYSHEFYKEALLLNQLNHPNILPFLGVNTTLFPGMLALVRPWMVNGSITEYLKVNPKLDKLRVISEIAAGITYLHSHNIVHNSIKGANILVDEQERCYIADFGFRSGQDRGETRWIAPEVLSLKNHPKQDIYAYACTVYEIIAGQVPFADLKFLDIITIIRIKHGLRPSRPAVAWCPDNIWALVKQCWAQESHLRPTASAIHGFLSHLKKLRTAGLSWEEEFPDFVQENE